MPFSLQPLSDRILITLDETRTDRVGSLFIPETSQGRTQIGIVEAVGPAVPKEIAVGLRIVFEKYSGTEIEIATKRHLILRLSDVLAIVRESPQKGSTRHA